jgi:large subunit ribosomal protein L6
MSRVGKKPIKIPQGVEVKIEDSKVTAKGQKGELSVSIPREIEVKQDEGVILVTEKKSTKESKAFWGTTRSLIFNIIEGVSVGYQRELQIKGIGYRAETQGEGLTLKVGFSHPVVVDKVEGITFEVKKDIIVISGIKKELVGRVAAEIRNIRPPEPYKGKGIRYKDEVVVLKEGKKSVGK